MKITLNGDPFELPAPLTVSELLSHLQIDPRRVAIEHNLVVIRRNTFDTTTLAEGDQVEIVNFVGGGEWNPVRRGQGECDAMAAAKLEPCTGSATSVCAPGQANRCAKIAGWTIWLSRAAPSRRA